MQQASNSVPEIHYGALLGNIKGDKNYIKIYILKMLQLIINMFIKSHAPGPKYSWMIGARIKGVPGAHDSLEFSFSSLNFMPGTQKCTGY